jgi:hypothetical protein
MQEFVAERYLPADARAAAAGGADAARAAAEELTREGTAIEFVRSIFIPEDETCLHLYRAESRGAVQALADRAALRLERVTEAVTDSGCTDKRDPTHK